MAGCYIGINMNFLLNTSNLDRIPLTGRLIRRQLSARSDRISDMTKTMTDPDISVVIRTRNDGAYIRQLISDIRSQEYDGQVEIIVVDTESTDDTVSYASSQGARVIPITQAEFNYPRALNAGFAAAKYPYVLTLVGHSHLASRMMFKSLTYWSQHEKFAGMYGLPLANHNGSIWDRLGVAWLPIVLTRPYILRRYSGSMMAANCSFVKRDVWQKLGGYDERYAGGGEDVALARSMLAANLMIVREPLMTLFHSHGLNFMNSLKQALHWIRVGMKKPQGFDTQKVHARRPDLR